MRAAVAVLVIVRTAAEFRVLFTRKGAPMLVGIAVLTIWPRAPLLLARSQRSSTFADGLWLAFITGATVGYGDVVPTTGDRLLAVLTVLVGVAMYDGVHRARRDVSSWAAEDAKMRDALQHEIRDLRREIPRPARGAPGNEGK
jgi:voltage-gated potassium channel